MEIINLENAQKVPFNLDGRIMHSEERVELVHLLLKPGESLDMHKNPFDVVFFVLEGNGVLAIEEESQLINANSTVAVSKENMRAWRNESEENLRILVIKILN